MIETDRTTVICVIVMIIFGIIPLSWYRSGYVILKGDNSPFWFVASRTFLDDMSMWWDVDSLGHMSGLPTLAVYDLLWYSLQLIGLSNGLIQVLLASIFFVSSGLTMFYLLSILTGKSGFPSLVGSIFYMTNVSVMLSIFNVGMNWMRAFLPLVLAVFLKLVRKRTNGEPSGRLLLCFLVIFSLSMSFLTINPPILVVSLLCIFAFAVYVALTEKRFKALQESGKIFLLSLTVSLWWIIPFAFLVLQNVGPLTESVNSWAWSWTHSRASIVNLFWLNGEWAWLPEYYPFIGYYSEPIVIISTFIPMLLAGFSLLFKKGNRILRYFSILIVLTAILLAKGLHAPFEQLNAFLYEFIPWFSELFREPVSKFTFMATLFLAPLIACSADFILSGLQARLRSKRRVYEKIASFSIVSMLALCFITSSVPIFLGWVAETKTDELPFPSYVRIPDHWVKLSEFFSNDTEDYRVLVTPDDDFYQMPYKWGYYGSDDLPLRFTSKPVLYHTFGYYQNPASATLEVLYQALENGDTPTFNNLLSALNVKYIVLRNDILANFARRSIINPEVIKSHLLDNTDIEYVQNIGELDIFQYRKWTPLHFMAPDNVFIVESSSISFDALSQCINPEKGVMISLKEFESLQTVMHSNLPSYFGYIVKTEDFNQTQTKFSKKLKLHESGVYRINVISNQSLTMSIDGNPINLSDGNSSSLTTDVYIDEGDHEIEIGGLLEEKLLLLSSWKDATIENQFWTVYTIEIEQDTLEATLYNSTWGWKTLNAPPVELREGEQCMFLLELGGKNVHQLNAKIFGYDENHNITEVSYGSFLFEGDFEWTSVNITYSPLSAKTRHAQLQLLHGHETDEPLPNIIWLRNARVLINRTSGFGGLSMFQNYFVSEGLDAEDLQVDLEYVKVAPYQYRIHVKAEEPFLLAFSEAYDSMWKIMEGDQNWYGAPFCATLSSSHMSVNGYGNMWYINKTGSYDITVFYMPQAYFFYAIVVSGLAIGVLSLLQVVRYVRENEESLRTAKLRVKKKASQHISLFSFGSPIPLSGIFIRTRQLIRALLALDQSLTVIEFNCGNHGINRGDDDLNGEYHSIDCVSLIYSKGNSYSPIRHIAFQFESLETVRLAKLLRNSPVVIVTSCLQVFPALVSKFLGAKIILDINDVNSRVAKSVHNTVTRIVRYFFWRPLEGLCCMLASFVIVNKEEESEFLVRQLHVDPEKILVIKTCLEESQNESGQYAVSENIGLSLDNKRTVLFVANMTTFMNQRAAQYIINDLAPSFAKSDDFKDVMFTLAGVGSEKIQTNASNVITTGAISEASLNALVEQADICIDPAIISGGVKTKIQYYLKKGKVIVTTLAGAEGINLYGRRDLAFLKSTIRNFESTLKHALKNLEFLSKMAANNRIVYEKQFSWETFIEQVATLIDKISETNNHVGDSAH